ncbi:hypothetical protein [Sinomonas sp. B1-1]|uniref:hypothetical protein n=1 Tax=Sinomonas sp. B1-1 TaxID=3141454 RepID=UPI003D2C16B4
MGKAQRNRAERADAMRTSASETVQSVAGEDLSGPDRFIPGFTGRQADLLRGHCAEAVRARGLRARDFGSHLAVTGGPFRGSGAQLGLTSIARAAARVPEEVWGEVASSIVGQLVGGALEAAQAGGGRPGSGLGYAGKALRERLFPRFSAPGRIPDEVLGEDYTYARKIAGLPLLLAFRREETSLLLADVHLAKAGGLEAAWEAAEANLFSAGFDEVQAYAKDGVTVLHLEGDHPRMASWLAYPDRLMVELGLEPGRLGVFFGVPALRMITLHLVDEETTVEGLEGMLGLNAILGKEEIAPLSGHLYWWRPGEQVQAATSNEDGALALTLPASVMRAVAGPDGDYWEVA